jgi:uncharacterized protein (TIGR02996 family)
MLPPPRNDTEARLLAAIDEHHESDGPRGVYADWLLDQGDERGELFAIQTQLERGAGPWRAHVLDRRMSEILNTGYYTPVFYRRGVPDGVRLDPIEIKEQLPAHLQLGRWSTTRNEAYAAGMARLASHAQASHIVELDLKDADQAWVSLLDGALRPRRLVLPRFAGRYADIPANGSLASDVVARLHDAPLCERVEQLELSAAIGDAGLAGLVDAAWMKRVTSLASGGIINYATAHGLRHLGHANGPIGDAGVRAIARHMHALRRLDLRWNLITADGVRALADSDLALDELRLSLDGLGVAGLAALERSRLASVARVYQSNHSPTEPAAYRALVESPLWAERWIDLWVEIGADITAITDAIASAREPQPIEELRIRGAELDHAQLGRLLDSPAMASLRHFALVEPRGKRKRTLFASVAQRPLETLFIMRCFVGDGLEQITTSPHAPAIENLFLEECELGNAGIQQLARSALRPIELELEDRADIATHVELLGSPLLSRTERLRLFLRPQSSPFETEPVKRVLLESPHLSAIKRISLQGLEAFSKEDKIEIKHRFGVGFWHPGVY